MAIPAMRAMRRRFPDAFSALNAAATAAERMGDQVRLTKSLLMLGRTHTQTGDLARASMCLLCSYPPR